MKYFPIVLGAICLLVQASYPADAEDNNLANAISSAKDSSTNAFLQAESGTILENGKEDQPPKTYEMMKLDDEEYQSFGHLHITKDGKATFRVTPAKGKLSELTIEKATDLFGKPTSKGHSEYTNENPFVVFNLKCFGWLNEPEIYHLDVQTDKNGKFVKVRERGFCITQPEWKTVN